MEKYALLYIITPIVLLTIVYLLVVTITWPQIRRHSYLSVYWLLLLVLLFPPGFFIFALWFYVIHFGFMTSRYYIYDNPPVIRTNESKTLSQRERRAQNV